MDPGADRTPYLIIGHPPVASRLGRDGALRKWAWGGELANIPRRGAAHARLLVKAFDLRRDETEVGRTQLVRFIVMWLGTTTVSTVSMGLIDEHLGLQWAQLAKPAVEGVLGVVGFVLSRHWVYKK